MVCMIFILGNSNQNRCVKISQEDGELQVSLVELLMFVLCMFEVLLLVHSNLELLYISGKLDAFHLKVYLV